MPIVSTEGPPTPTAPALDLHAAECASCGETLHLLRRPLPGELCGGCEAEQE